MNLLTAWARIRQRRNPARELAMIGVEKRRRTIKHTAQQIRRELGLPDDPRLA